MLAPPNTETFTCVPGDDDAKALRRQFPFARGFLRLSDRRLVVFGARTAWNDHLLIEQVIEAVVKFDKVATRDTYLVFTQVRSLLGGPNAALTAGSLPGEFGEQLHDGEWYVTRCVIATRAMHPLSSS